MPGRSAGSGKRPVPGRHRKGIAMMSGEDWARAREVVEPAVDMVAAEILAAGVNPGFLGAALVIAGTNLVNEHDGPDKAVRLLEGLIETLEAPPKGPVLQVVGDEGDDSAS